MIKVVIDTGIVVSAAFRDRVPEEIILFITGQDEFEWIVSTDILEEYNEVLTREKFGLTPPTLSDPLPDPARRKGSDSYCGPVIIS